MNEVKKTGLKPFCDKDGFDFRNAREGSSRGELLLKECAMALDVAAEWYSDPSNEPVHPLAYLAALTRAIARNALSDELSKVYSVIIRQAYRLDERDILMVAEWAQTLADEAQARRTRRM